MLNFLKLKKYFEDKTLYTLLAVVSTNLLKNQPVWYQDKISRCVNKTISIQSYARCISPMIIRRKKRQVSFKIKKRNRKTKRLNVITDERKNKEEDTNVLYNKEFTLPPIDFFKTKQEKSFSTDGIADVFYSFVKSIKQKTGPWFTLPNVTITNNGNRGDSNQEGTHNQAPNSFLSTIESLMKSPILLMKQFPDNNFDFTFTPTTVSQEQDSIIIPEDYANQNVRVLSPRVLHLLKSQQEINSVLSPDFFSMYEGGTNNVASIPSLLNLLSLKEKSAWMRFFSEITGVSDIFNVLKSLNYTELLYKSKISLDNGEAIFVNKTFDILTNVIGDVFKILTENQVNKLNDEGFTFLSGYQLDSIYKERKNSLQFDIEEYNRKTDEEKYSLLYQEILNLASGRQRVKRDKVGGNNGVTILSPYLGGTTLTTYLLSPTILSPSSFSYLILGPLVLSPYIFSPYIFGPFILSPEVLTPFIFSPFAIAPTVLGPAVLSSNIFSPVVLAPYILCPTVLNPTIFSPSALSPTVLSPGVLSPSIFSDSVLSPSVLSPCLLCRKRRKRNVHYRAI